ESRRYAKGTARPIPPTPTWPRSPTHRQASGVLTKRSRRSDGEPHEAQRLVALTGAHGSVAHRTRARRILAPVSHPPKAAAPAVPKVRLIGAPPTPFRDVYHAFLRLPWSLAIASIVLVYLG